MTYELIHGDARKVSDLLEPASVDLIVTSPPYFALRSYRDECEACDGTGEWREGVEARPPPRVTPNNDHLGSSTLGARPHSEKMKAQTTGNSDGCAACNGTGRSHYDGQLGSEATPGEFVDALIECTRDWLKVLKPGGSIFVNLGDKRSGSNGQSGGFSGTVRGGQRFAQLNNSRDGIRDWSGIPAKSLMGLPWRYALRCVDELGLILRADIIWHKPNGLPESVTDRVRQSHEYWFHLTREARYFASVDEVREAQMHPNGTQGPGFSLKKREAEGQGRSLSYQYDAPNPLGKLPGSVWTIPSEPLTVPDHLGVDHFAAFPSEWPRRLILGWSPTGWCTACGEPRRAVVDVDWSKVPHQMVEKRVISQRESFDWCVNFAEWCRERGITRTDLDEAAGTSDMGGWWASTLSHRCQVPTPEQWSKLRARFDPPATFDRLVHSLSMVPVAEWETPDTEQAGRHKTTKGAVLSSGEYRSILGYACACSPDINGWPTAPTRPAVILDPFAGTGTTVAVAHHLGRHGIGIDLSKDYLRLAEWRCEHDTALRDKVLQRSDLPKAPVIDGQLALDFL